MRAFLQRFGEREALLAVGCIVSGLVFSILSPYFATTDNLLTIARNSTELLLIGLGMTLLLGIGGIDVSVGSVLGLAAIGIGRLLEAGMAPALAALAGPVIGFALGALTAFVVSFGRIPAIVATLGLFGVYRAGIFLALGGSWLSGLPVGLTNLLAVRIFPPARFSPHHRARLRRRLCRRSAHAIRRAPSRHRQFGSKGAARRHRRAQGPGRSFRYQRRPVRTRCDLLCRDLSQRGDDDRRDVGARSGGRGRPRRHRRDRRTHQPSGHGLWGQFSCGFFRTGCFLSVCRHSGSPW